LASGRPTIVCVTSGTAAAELHAAVVEAHYGRVALILCTADRPPELQDTGASQTIDQVGLFTTATRWFANPGVPGEGQAAVWRPLAARAHAEATRGPSGPGPVHLNLAFREPLTGAPDALPPHGPDSIEGARATPRSPVNLRALDGTGIIVVGGLTPEPPAPILVLEVGERMQWPVLADPRSGSRLPGTIAAADAIVRTEPPLPATVVLIGSPWLSKALSEYVGAAAADGARVIVVDPWRQWTDPNRVATEFHQCDVNAWLSVALASATPIGPEWLQAWRSMEDKAQAAIERTLGRELSEPLVARTVYAHAARTGSTLLVSASMPIRDLEWYAAAELDPPVVLANRGANGIDGVVSTALGVAASGEHTRTIALLGDLAFLHDVSGLVNLGELDCIFVVVDNGGGGIFSFLPQAALVEPDAFERLFGTPPRSDVAQVARGFGLSVVDVTTLADLGAALETRGPALVRVRVPNRSVNVGLHAAINQAVGRALG
jgi:2-succinyl-5-enolpyruvyl-6-hydroxy-3-cyclohexene-1-carboxylate synthase